MKLIDSYKKTGVGFNFLIFLLFLVLFCLHFSGASAIDYDGQADGLQVCIIIFLLYVIKYKLSEKTEKIIKN